jgi:hypothetical protein
MDDGTCVSSIQGPFRFAMTADEYTWNRSVRLISAIGIAWRITFYFPWVGIPRMAMMDSKGLSSLVCFGGRLRDERYSVMVTLRDHYQNE